MCKSMSEITQWNMLQREIFNFIEVVRYEFSYLSSYGFQCVKEEPTFVRYESETTFLNIYHGRSSFEIAAEFGWLKHDSQLYNIYELMRLSDPEEAERYRKRRNYIAIRPETVVTGVKRLSSVIKRYSSPFLNNDSTISAKLAKQQKEIINRFADEILSSQVRPKAEEAFRRKNYAEVVKLYESIESQLSMVERKKLEYCRKRL